MTVEDLEMTTSFSVLFATLVPGDSFKNSQGAACVVVSAAALASLVTAAGGTFTPDPNKKYFVRLDNGDVGTGNNENGCDKVKLKAVPE